MTLVKSYNTKLEEVVSNVKKALPLLPVAIRDPSVQPESDLAHSCSTPSRPASGLPLPLLNQGSSPALTVRI